MSLHRFIAVVLFSVLAFALRAQQKDSLARINDSIARAEALHKKIYSLPRKATIMSAVVPGLGQMYVNPKKWWKLPIIYGGLGGFGYMFYFNNDQYQLYRKEVIAANDDDPNTKYDTRYTPDQLQTQKLYYKKFRDMSIFGFGIIYVLNIIDANVDAHMKTFDVSDDLSLNLSPWHTFARRGNDWGSAAGISVKLNFK